MAYPVVFHVGNGGRIGQPGRLRLAPRPEAADAKTKLVGRKERKGYRRIG
ncbi:hypothetical protein [Rhodovibrio sodomensis]|nr:hypothetical protein [Rhodovibrio sodomensis]